MSAVTAIKLTRFIIPSGKAFVFKHPAARPTFGFAFFRLLEPSTDSDVEVQSSVDNITFTSVAPTSIVANSMLSHRVPADDVLRYEFTRLHLSAGSGDLEVILATPFDIRFDTFGLIDPPP